MQIETARAEYLCEQSDLAFHNVCQNGVPIITYRGTGSNFRQVIPPLRSFNPIKAGGGTARYPP